MNAPFLFMFPKETAGCLKIDFRNMVCTSDVPDRGRFIVPMFDCGHHVWAALLSVVGRLTSFRSVEGSLRA